jgi:mRNA interferase HigB
MQVIALRILREFWKIHPRAERRLRAWYAAVARADWQGPADIKAQFGTNVDFVADNRVVFDIGGNEFRVVARVSYPFKRVLIKFVGTHAEYDRIDAATVSSE